MAAQAIEVVRESAVAGEVTVVRSADARYVGQGYEVTVPVPAGRLDAAALARDARELRRGLRRALRLREPRTSRSRSSPGSSSAIGGSPRIALAKAAARSGEGRRKGTRRAYFPETRGYADTPVYDRYALAPGASLTGPAIVEERESTTVLPPGVTATVDEYANLLAEVDPR